VSDNSITSQAKHFYEFGPFRLDADQQLLLRSGEIVPLAPKALELLLVLVTSDGRLLTKQELLERVWPNSFVEEANLSHNIYKLRESLGEKENDEKYIETLPRRGYRFVAKVTEVRDEPVHLLVREQTRAAVVVEEKADSSHSREFAADRTALLSTDRPHKSKLIFWVGLASLICVAAVAFYFLWRRHSTVSSPIHSVAVLPFRPLSAEGRDQALELGMADALITKLSNVHQIVVRPMSAMLKYNDGSQDVLAAGREQAVDAVVDGKVQKVGDRIRATVQLLRVSDGASIWAETFDDQFTNVFAVQDSISDRAARALVSQLSGEEAQRISRHYTDNIQAYQLYLEGRYYWAKFSDAGVSRSIDYYNQAIAIDPAYALAYAGLADAYSVQGAMGSLSPAESMPQMKRAIDAALRLDASLAQAHQAAGGLALLYERDWPTAKRELERAIELNPNVSDPHQLLGYYWEVMGDLERAQHELELAQKVAPLMSVVNMDLAALAYYRRNYDEAINLYNQAHNLDPDFIPLPFFPTQAYERKGLYQQAITTSENELRSAPDDPALLALLGYAYARAGKVTEANSVQAKLEQMQQTRYISPFMLAIFYTGAGENDKAFAALNQASDVHDPQLIWVKVDPELDPLHSDARFTELLQRLKI
jgi:DNA-binding winged helix-turn-helix (wHTH) protein/TolB-like protein/Flp pilus assembly protein TadD